LVALMAEPECACLMADAAFIQVMAEPEVRDGLIEAVAQ
jgi:hypothetical protein